MNIELDDGVMSKIDVSESELVKFVAISLYKYKGIHGALAGKLMGLSEFEFHSMLSKMDVDINYDASDLIDDIKSNNL